MTDPEFINILSVGCSRKDCSIINSAKTLRGIKLLPKNANDSDVEGSDFSEASEKNELLQLIATFMYFSRKIGKYSDLIYANTVRLMTTFD
jgi:hypothetical protein